eukprot:3806966-Pyramimonas_sp.AAC.1
MVLPYSRVCEQRRGHFAESVCSTSSRWQQIILPLMFGHTMYGYSDAAGSGERRLMTASQYLN